MKNYSHNCRAGFSGLCVWIVVLISMQITSFCWVLGCRKMGWRWKGSWEKIKEGGAREACCSPSLAAMTRAECHTHPENEKMEASFSYLLLSRVPLERCLPNKAFYSPVLVGMKLLEGRRKEDYGCTLGRKRELIFVEKIQPMSTAPVECDRKFFGWEKSTSLFASWPIGASLKVIFFSFFN